MYVSRMIDIKLFEKTLIIVENALRYYLFYIEPNTHQWFLIMFNYHPQVIIVIFWRPESNLDVIKKVQFFSYESVKYRDQWYQILFHKTKWRQIQQSM